MALTSDDLNYLIFQYLLEAGYSHSAFIFGNESLAKDAQVAPGDFCPSTLVDIVQKGIQYKELQTRLAANGSALRAYTAAELLRCKDPSDLIKAATLLASNPSCSPPSARQRFSDHKGHVYSLTWHPSQMVLASGAADAAGRIYHVGSSPKAQKTCDLLPHNVPGNTLNAEVTGISWSPQGDRLASVTLDGHMRIWGKNGSLHMCAADLPPLQGVQFSPGGEYIAAHAADAGMVAVWHASTGMLAADFGRHHGAVLSLCWLSDSSFATCGQDGAVHTNRIKLLPQGTADDHVGQDSSMNYREESQGAENVQAQGHLTVAWERNMQVHHGHVNEVCASSDGLWLAAGCDDGTVRAWRTGLDGSGGVHNEPEEPFLLQDPALMPQQLSHRAVVHSARFWHLPSHNGPKEADRKAELGGATEASISSPSLLATCSGVAKGGRGGTKAPGTEAAIKIWDVAQGTHVRTLMPLEGTKYMHAMGADVTSVEWCHDGSWLAVGMAQGVIELVPFGS